MGVAMIVDPAAVNPECLPLQTDRQAATISRQPELAFTTGSLYHFILDSNGRRDACPIGNIGRVGNRFFSIWRTARTKANQQYGECQISI
jgi:hypothetical protein